MNQLPLFTGYYRCDDCGALVDRLRQTRRFRLCDACYERVVPVFPDGRIEHGSPEHKANEAYWEWYGEMDERVPRRSEPGYTAQTRQPTPSPRPTDDYYPLCACGQPREPFTHAIKAGVPTGLFGGPFARECPTCEARHQVERVMESTTRYVGPGRARRVLAIPIAVSPRTRCACARFPANPPVLTAVAARLRTASPSAAMNPPALRKTRNITQLADR